MESLERQQTTFFTPDTQRGCSSWTFDGTKLNSLSSALVKMLHKTSVHRGLECHCKEGDVLLPSLVHLPTISAETFASISQWGFKRTYDSPSLYRLWQPDTEVFPSLNDTMDKGNVFRNTAPYIHETGRKFRFDAVAESSGDTEFIRSMHFWTMRSLNQMGHYEALLCHVKVHLAATRLCIEDLAQVSMKRLQMCLYYVPITERVAADIFRLFVDLDQYEQQGEDTDDVKYELLRYMIAHHDVLSDLAAYRFCLDHYPNVARDLVLLINELIREGTPEEEEDFWTED